MSDASEVTYLQASDCLVTSSRIQIGSQTFATRNVGSVSIARTSARVWPWIVAVLGLLVMLPPLTAALSSGGWVFGACIFAFGAFVGWRTRGHFELSLLAGGSSSIALQTRDKASITRLHDAIVQAIAAR